MTSIWRKGWKLSMILQNKKIAVIGGDLRQQALAQFLAEKGAEIYTYGFAAKLDSAVVPCGSMERATAGADLVLLPLPAFSEEGFLKTNGERRITLYDIITASGKDSLLLGGMLREDARKLLAKQGRVYVDYYESEELQQLNAIPTAEGAIALAMQARPRTIAGSRCLVIGFGRIGRVLSRDLAALGAHVTASARNPAHISMIEQSGFASCSTGDLSAALARADIIFNTVPAEVISDRQLSGISPKAVLIELASAPYGFSFAKAAELGLHTVLGASLPGKVAPETAGEAIGKVILSILTKRGVL